MNVDNKCVMSRYKSKMVEMCKCINTQVSSKYAVLFMQPGSLNMLF